MKKCGMIFCILLAAVFVGVPSFFAFAGEQGTLGDSQVAYVFDENSGTLTLTGTGATPDYTPESLPPFAAYRSQIRTVQVEEGITRLGDNLFRQLTAVTQVQLPESLTAIGSNTFFHAAALQTITVPAGVQSIGSYAFAACSALTDIWFDNMAGSLQLGACAFIDCKALTAAQFPVGTSFGQYAVGYQDEDGRPMTAFTLRGLTGTTAQYYADAAAQITFDPALELAQGATFGNIFQSYSGTDWYRYTPTATGTYHFYSMGSVDTVVRLCDSSKADLGVGSDDRSPYDLNFDLTCTLQAGETYYFRVTNNHSLGAYTAYLYPGKVTAFSAAFPADMVLITGRDSTVRTDAKGQDYAYFDLNPLRDQLQITITYDTGDRVTLPLTDKNYNGYTFSLTDDQATNHWTEGTYTATLTWGDQTAAVPVQVHTHIYTAQRTEPTCVADGQILYTCTCGDSYATPIAKLGHTAPAAHRVDPTCTLPGYTYTYCTRCNVHLSDTVSTPALGHDYTATVIPPTTTAEGCTRYTCRRCGYSYDTDFQPALSYTITGRAVAMEGPDGSHQHNYPLVGTSVEMGNERVQTGEDGTFSIAVASGTYTLIVGGDFYLYRTVTVTVSEKSVDLGDVPVMVYDVNGDGYVNARDLVTYQQYAAAIDRGEGEYERLLDFDGDGQITPADMDGAAAFIGAGKLDHSIYQ